MGKRNSKKNRQKQNNKASDNKIIKEQNNEVQQSLEENKQETPISETNSSNVEEIKKDEAVSNEIEQPKSDNQWSIDNEETPIHLIEGEELYHVTEDDKSEYKLPKKKHIDSKNIISIVAFILGAAVIVMIVLFKQSISDATEAAKLNETLNEQYKSLSGDYDALKVTLDEANEKNKLLSDSLNAKSLELESLSTENANQHIPFSYPLKGTAAIKNDEIELEDDLIDGQENAEGAEAEQQEDGIDNKAEATNDIVYFICDSGTRVIATGAGVVESVTKKESENEVTGHLDFMGNFIADQNYDTYEIVIDHGNGYKTIYTASGSVLIDEGDIVSKSSVILYIEKSDTIFGYQVQLEGEYIDPLSCMEISG